MRAELVAVITSVIDGVPMVLTAGEGTRLPSGPLQSDHQTMQSGMRAWVERQTGHELGYVEQLYTFADPGRETGDIRVLSVSYLGLTRGNAGEAGWRPWYDYFGWEDRRGGAPTTTPWLAALQRWSLEAGQPGAERALRAAVTFGLDQRPWRSDLVLNRYELLYEAGLLPESPGSTSLSAPAPGRAMEQDHRRILATGLARLRAKIQYRPVVFELMPPEFTLGQLQSVVESLAGTPLHKQNFRRLMLQQDLVEETGATVSATGGRPAKAYRFRRDVLDVRSVAGTKLPIARP